VLGGMPRFIWGAIAIGVALVALALSAAPADATTDRVDYSDQANPICASTNKQIQQTYEAFEAALERLDNGRPKNRKQARRQARKRDRLYERLYEELPLQVLALYKSELEQLKAISPPPGYEDTVARWLGTRGEIATLYEQYLQIDRELEGPLVDSGKRGKRPSMKAIKRAQKRRANLHRLEDQIDDRLLTDFEIDLELASKMGAAYCVTGADGEIATVVFEEGD
jgi:hypothetical protein